MFALRFGSPEIAKEFKLAFELHQVEMKKFVAGLDNEEGSKEAEEISSAIESLTVESKDVEGEKNVEEVKSTEATSE